METKTLAVLAAAALCACAGAQKPRPVGKSGFLGASLCPSPEGLEVVKVNSDSAASKAGLKTGDVLEGYNDAALTGDAARRNLLFDIRAGSVKKLKLGVRRGGKRLEVEAAPLVRDIFAQDELNAALSDEIVAGRKVSVAVIVTEVEHTRPELFDNARALETWKAAMRTQVASNFETLLLNKSWLRCGNYAVADRQKTDQVLKELGFQMTGAVSPETAREVGKMIGASHLLFVSFTRFQSPSGDYEDDSSVRLVAVESDSVLASLRFRQTVARD